MKNVQLAHVHHRPAPVRRPLRLLAHDMGLASNVGTLFRIADALGVEHLHLCGDTPVPPDPRIRRSARAAERFVPWSHAGDALAVVAGLRRDGWRIVCLELSTASVDIARFEVAPGDRLCLVLGAEDAGVPQALLDAADGTVHIPMLGHNSSMNVAAACAIAAYELGRRLDG